jgi:hypothetical protein
MNELREAFDPVANAFEALQIDYRVGGSVASSRFGVARTTLDIDVVADIRSEHIDDFVARLAATYYVDAESIREAIARQRSFNVIHLRTMIKVDVFVLKRRAFDRFAFTRPRAEPIGEDHSRLFTFSSPEDMILLKLEWSAMARRARYPAHAARAARPGALAPLGALTRSGRPPGARVGRNGAGLTAWKCTQLQ